MIKKMMTFIRDFESNQNMFCVSGMLSSEILIFVGWKKRIPKFLGLLNVFCVYAFCGFHWEFQKGNDGLHL
jgi:hypothetical protein